MGTSVAMLEKIHNKVSPRINAAEHACVKKRDWLGKTIFLKSIHAAFLGVACFDTKVSWFLVGVVDVYISDRN